MKKVLLRTETGAVTSRSPCHSETHLNSRLTSQPPEPVHHGVSSLVHISWCKHLRRGRQKRIFQKSFHGVAAGLKKKNGRPVFTRFWERCEAASIKQKSGPKDCQSALSFHFSCVFELWLQNVVSVGHQPKKNHKKRALEHLPGVTKRPSGITPSQKHTKKGVNLTVLR